MSGENIDTSLTRIRSMMDTIAAAFDKQLDSLFGEEALDISTDISVLETMMAREGLTGAQMSADANSRDESNITLKL